MNRIWIRACVCALGTLAAACSVKEDRTPCPCVVSLDMTECLGAGDMIVTVWNEGMVYRRYSSPSEGRKLLECEVPRGQVTISAVSVRDAGRLEGSVLTIPQGSCPDSVYACAGVIDASGENALGQIALRKQFASVSLDTRLSLYIGDTACARVRINVCGMDIRDLSAVGGDLSFKVTASEDGIFRFQLPRLPDGNVKMLFGRETHLHYPLDLGEIMRQGGYDWDAPDLSDINIRTGPTEKDFRVEIIPWQGFRIEDVVI